MKNKIFEVYIQFLIYILETLGVVKWMKKISPQKIPNQQLVIVNEAKNRGLLIENLQKGSLPTRFFRFKQEKKYHYFESIPIGNSYNRISSEKASDKWAVKKILQKEGLPTPDGWIITKLSQALDFISQKGFPVVIKPTCESKCIGVTIDIRNPRQLQRAIQHVRKYGKKFLIEKFLIGRDYRVTVVNDQVAGVCLRKRPQVVGDGQHTILQLIRIKNQDPRRGIGKNYTLHPIKTDRFTSELLKQQKVNLHSKINKGKTIVLSKRINLGSGADTIDISDKIHPQIAKLCIRVTKLFDANLLGLDILATNISQSLSKKNLVSIIEINPFPFIDIHHYPYKGKTRNIAGAIWNMVLDKR